MSVWWTACAELQKRPIISRLWPQGKCALRPSDYGIRLGILQFYPVAEFCARTLYRPGRQLEDIHRSRNERACPKGYHARNRVFDVSISIQEQNVDWKTHANRMDGFLSAQNQPLAGLERLVPEQSAQPRPCCVCDVSILYKNGISVAVCGAQFSRHLIVHPS